MSVRVTRDHSGTELQRNQKVVRELKVSGQWGRQNGGLGCPPILSDDFKRRLHSFDPELVCWFNSVVHRWQLYWNGKKVMTVQGVNDSYKHPDGYEIYLLKKGDSRVRGQKFVDEITDHNREVVESDERDFQNKVESVAPDLQKWMAKESEADVGAINIPKEDLVVPDSAELERRRNNRRKPKNYRRKPMPYFEVDNEMGSMQGAGVNSEREFI